MNALLENLFNVNPGLRELVSYQPDIGQHLAQADRDENFISPAYNTAWVGQPAFSSTTGYSDYRMLPTRAQSLPEISSTGKGLFGSDSDPDDSDSAGEASHSGETPAAEGSTDAHATAHPAATGRHSSPWE